MSLSKNAKEKSALKHPKHTQKQTYQSNVSNIKIKYTNDQWELRKDGSHYTPSLGRRKSIPIKTAIEI